MTDVTFTSGNTYSFLASFDNYLFRTNFLPFCNDIIAEGQRAVDAADDAAADAVTVAADAVTVAADKAIVAADKASAASSASTATTQAGIAVAAAASVTKGIAFATTAGTGAAYTADFTPNIAATDGEMFSLDIHATNSSTTPTLAVDGGSAYTMVDENGRPIPLGNMSSGLNVLVTFDAENSQYRVVSGLPFHEFNTEVDARGNALTNCPVKHKPPCPIMGEPEANIDYVLGYIDYDSTLNGGMYLPDEGTGTLVLYLSADKTSAAGTAIAGGTFDALSPTTPDVNSFTADNVVVGASPRYLIGRFTSVSGLVNVKGNLTETKNTDD